MSLPPPAPPSAIPVVEEHVSIGVERRETGAVRIRLEDTTRDASLPLERHDERVAIERVPVNRVVAERREPWHEGAVLVVPVYAEVPVVERRLLLVEEIRLRLERTGTTETVTVPLRAQRAVVERRMPDGGWVEAGPGVAP